MIFNACFPNLLIIFFCSRVLGHHLKHVLEHERPVTLWLPLAFLSAGYLDLKNFSLIIKAFRINKTAQAMSQKEFLSKQ